MTRNKLATSFVIPVYRSEKTLERVISEIHSLRNVEWEAILVNDNSPDNVDVVIREFIRLYPANITYIRLRKNYGQQAAIINGFAYVTKPLVATIDDDGQNPPKEIFKLAAVMKEQDLDVVYGIFKVKKHSIFRSTLSTLNSFMSPLTIGNKRGFPLSNVRLMKQSVARAIAKTSSRNNYIDGLIFSLTDHVGYTFVEHRERFSGNSTYNMIKLTALWVNHMIGYSNILIKSIAIMSFIISLVAFLAGITYFFITINNPSRPTGWLSTYITVTFLFSFLFLLFAVLSAYISRIYTSTNQNETQLIHKVYEHT